MSNNPPTSFRLSVKAKRLLKELSEKLGISQTAVLEVIIRDRAKVERIDEETETAM